jgi:hypothetical protein
LSLIGSAQRCCSPAASKRHPSSEVPRLFEKLAIEPSGATACSASLIEFVELILGHRLHGTVRVLVETIESNTFDGRKYSRWHETLEDDAQRIVSLGFNNRRNRRRSRLHDNGFDSTMKISEFAIIELPQICPSRINEFGEIG